QIGPVLDFAQRAGDLATQLGGDFRGAVSKRCVAVDYPADQLGQGHRLPLGLAGDVAQTVYEGQVGRVEQLGRRLDGLIDRGRPAVDQRVRVQALGGVVLEPRLAEDAGPLGLGKPLAVGVELDVVADAAAEGTRRVLDYGQVHYLAP